MTRNLLANFYTVLLVVLLLTATIEAKGSKGGGSRGSSGSRSSSSSGSKSTSNSKSNSASNSGAKKNTNNQYNNKQNTVYVSRAVSNQRYDRFTEGAAVGYIVGSSQRRRYYYHQQRHDYDRDETEFGEFVCRAEVNRSLLMTADNVTTTTTWRPELNSTVIPINENGTSALVMVYWKCADNEVCTVNDCRRDGGSGGMILSMMFFFMFTTLWCAICIWGCIRGGGRRRGRVNICMLCCMSGRRFQGSVLNAPPPEAIYPRQQMENSNYYPAANSMTLIQYTSGTQETMMGATTTGYGAPMYPTTIVQDPSYPPVMAPPPAYNPADQKVSYGVGGVYSNSQPQYPTDGQQPPAGYSAMAPPNYSNQ